MTIKLKSAHIENFKSLGDITLNFKDLTILVGANSSGKSNCLEALKFLVLTIKQGLQPTSELIRFIIRVCNQKNINIQTFFEQESFKKNVANYQLLLSLTPENFYREVLSVDGIKIIDVQQGKGTVQDEDGKNAQFYNSNAGDLALKFAGYFGNKPFTSELIKFIEGWQFYDIDPDSIRKKILSEMLNLSKKNSHTIDIIPTLSPSGTTLEDVLCYWYENDLDRFKAVNQELEECLNINLEVEYHENSERIIKVKETDQTKVSLSNMSDGTFRLLGYYTLLHQEKIPPLIGIEEPERNFHPGILRNIAAILKKLSKRTQIIVTTHSSQLLDCFTYDDIMSDVAVILLSKKDDSGTQAIALDELSQKREDLKEWMQDFGVGSAVYDSHLLDEILNKQNA
ncbi:AAA family ATPase [Crocosphaera sp.]|uniref:AAA family ATPase n=1 Tax=Crocosphaera sp. TaxID=2729996 RepID=UPI003F26E827|nr:AAA family ATPase [Crocosphaera sp.]